MHVLFAFLIGIAIISGIRPVKEIPENEFRFIIAPNDGLVSGNVASLTPHVLRPLEIRLDMRSAEDIEYSRIVRQRYDYSCGSAALATLLKYQLAEEFEETQIIHGLLKYGDKEKIIERRAFSLLDMKKFVNALGYQGVGYKAEIEDLDKLDMPCILPVELYGYRHFTVFKDIRQGHVFLADPFRGNTSYPIEQFKNLWHQNVIFVIYPSGDLRLSLLELKNDDLRYIDEDRALDIMLNDRKTGLEQKRIELDPERSQFFKR